ncbi:MAG: DUF6134 family protein [Kiloniellales bacterium]|nr:DUF6134 family protein [Kiloniellales bacterium]
MAEGRRFRLAKIVAPGNRLAVGQTLVQASIMSVLGPRQRPCEAGVLQRRAMLRYALLPVLSRSAMALGSAVGTLALGVGAASARRVFPADGQSEFLAIRNDRVIGRRRLAFSRDSGDLVVRHDTEFLAGPEGAPLHRFVQHSEESWRDGWLHAVVADSDDNGALWRVRAERRDGILQGQVNGAGFTVSGYPITSTLWHRDVPSQQALFDITDARVKLIRGREIGEETLALPGGTAKAKRYAIRGEINGDLWYDQDCRLVRASHPLRDGSLVVFELI